MVHSALTGSIPTGETAWVVLGSKGQYSDWRQWVVEVHLDEQGAKDRVGALSAALREIMAQEPATAFVGDDYTPEYAAWAIRVNQVDENADEYEQPSYTAREVPLITAAGGG